MLGADKVKLLSRVIRSNVVTGKTGAALFTPDQGALTSKTRRIDSILANKSSGDENIISRIFNAGGKFAGWLMAGVKWITTNLTTVAGWLFNGIEQIKSFNWNATDKEIQETIKSQWVNVSRVWGRVAGQAIGGAAIIAVGYGIGMVVPWIGGALLARAIASEVFKDRFDEFMQALGQAIRETIATLASNVTLSGYIWLRSSIKKLDRKTLANLFGESTANWIKDHWGGEGEPVISFNQKMDDAVESIKNPYTKAFTEELAEEAWDSFVEGGYTIAQELDQAYEQYWRAQEQQKGPDREIIIAPDKNAPDDVLVIPPMPQEEAKTLVISGITTHRQLYNKDVGEWVGMRLNDGLKIQPQLRTLKLFFHEREKPPFKRADGKYESTCEVSIPNPKRGLSYEEIRNACKPWIYGRAYAVGTTNTSKLIRVHAATEDQAVAKVKELAVLSADKVVRISKGQLEYIAGQDKPDSIKVYPQRATVTMPKNVLDAQNKLDVDARTFKKEILKFPLWLESKPDQFVLF